MKGKKGLYILMGVTGILVIGMAYFIYKRYFKKGAIETIQTPEGDIQMMIIDNYDDINDYGVVPDPKGGGYWFQRPKSGGEWQPYDHKASISMGGIKSKATGLGEKFIALVAIAKQRGYIQ
jgi:hypothetical protein